MPPPSAVLWCHFSSPRQRATPGLTLSLLSRYSAVAQAMQISVRPQSDMVTHGSTLRIALHYGTLCVEAIGFPHRTKPNWAFGNWPEPGMNGALSPLLFDSSEATSGPPGPPPPAGPLIPASQPPLINSRFLGVLFVSRLPSSRDECGKYFAALRMPPACVYALKHRPRARAACAI